MIGAIVLGATALQSATAVVVAAGAIPLDDDPVPRSNVSEGSERRAPEVWGP